MALIKSYKGLQPRWGNNCYFSENATLVGDVTLGDDCSIWFNAVVRGDVAPITIGSRTNIQDGSCIHVTHHTGPTHIGSDVTIGHNVTIHACTIRDGALIGMGATLLDGCDVGQGAIVAAGALVLQGTTIPARQIWGGVPAHYLKPAPPTDNAAHYVAYAREYMDEQTQPPHQPHQYHQPTITPPDSNKNSGGASSLIYRIKEELREVRGS